MYEICCMPDLGFDKSKCTKSFIMTMKRSSMWYLAIMVMICKNNKIAERGSMVSEILFSAAFHSDLE